MKHKKIFFGIMGVLFFFAIRFLYMRYYCYRGKIESYVKIGFLGDVMLGRLVNEWLLQNPDPLYPWGDMHAALQSTDVNIANMEFAFTTSEQIVPKVFNFKSLPKHVAVLQAGNIGVVNLANNHILDYDVQGLVQTIKTLDDAGIAHVGAGINKMAAQAPVILDIKGIKIGVIGCTDNEPTWIAAENKPGINYVQVGDIQSLYSMIQSIRPHVEVLILTMHWGPNMKKRPSKEFKQFAHDLIDAGVDIIQGHSAHVFQAIERYKHGLIMYDTGDAVDDYAVDSVLRNDRSFFCVLTLTKRGIIKANVIPFVIKDMQMHNASQEDFALIIQEMQQLSAEHQTVISDQGEIIL